MKHRHSLILGSALLAALTTASHATVYYWDSDSTTAGFGDTNGTWGTSAFWSTDITGASATANTTTTTSDTVNFGTATLAYGTSAKTIAVSASTKSVGAIVFGAAQTPAVKLTTTAMSGGNISLLGAGGSITVDGGSHLIEGTGTGSSGSSRDLAFTTGGITDVTFTIASGGSLEIKGRIGGGNNAASTKYTKTGTGTLILSGHNGSTSAWGFGSSTVGGFTVSQGVLRLALAGAAGLSSNKFTVSSGAAMELDGGFTQTLTTGTITLNGTGISSNGALRSLSGANQITGAGIVLNTNSSIGVDADNLTLTGIISGPGRNLTKVGAGTLTLSSSSNSYSGLTTISGGTLALASTGSIASTSGVNLTSSTAKFNVTTTNFTLGATQTLGGIGTVENAGRTFTANGILAPGSSPGTLTVDGGTLALGVDGDYNFQILNATGAAGTGYDTTNLVNGATLDLSSLTAGSYSINLFSLLSTGPDVAGNASNFNNTLSYSWTLFSTGSAITGFDAADFAINSAGFTNALGGGSFSVGLSGDNTDLMLNFTPVPEPRAALLGGLGMLALLRRRRN